MLILSGWSDGPLPALEHSLRQRGLRCARVPLPMPPCGVYWCANPFLLLLAGVVWLVIYAHGTSARSNPSHSLRHLNHRGRARGRAALRRRRRPVRGWHGAANARRLLARHRVALVVGFSWGGGIAHRLLASRGWRGPTLVRRRRLLMGCALRSPRRLDDARLKVVLASDDGFVPRAAGDGAGVLYGVARRPRDRRSADERLHHAIAGASASASPCWCARNVDVRQPARLGRLVLVQRHAGLPCRSSAQDRQTTRFVARLVVDGRADGAEEAVAAAAPRAPLAGGPLAVGAGGARRRSSRKTCTWPARWPARARAAARAPRAAQLVERRRVRDFGAPREQRRQAGPARALRGRQAVLALALERRAGAVGRARDRGCCGIHD